MFEKHISFSAKGITRKIVSMILLPSKQPTENNSAAKKKTMPRIIRYFQKDSQVSNEGRGRLGKGVSKQTLIQSPQIEFPIQFSFIFV